MRVFYLSLQRYIISEDEEHRQLFDLISRMLEYEPTQRIPLSESLNHPFFAKLPPELLFHKLEKSLTKPSTESDDRERSPHSISRWNSILIFLSTQKRRIWNLSEHFDAL